MGVWCGGGGPKKERKRHHPFKRLFAPRLTELHPYPVPVGESSFKHFSFDQSEKLSIGKCIAISFAFVCIRRRRRRRRRRRKVSRRSFLSSLSLAFCWLGSSGRLTCDACRPSSVSSSWRASFCGATLAGAGAPPWVRSSAVASPVAQK